MSAFPETGRSGTVKTANFEVRFRPIADVSSFKWYGTGTMLIIFILVTGIVVGILPGLLKLDKMFSITSIAVGFVGALVGAFLGFGDAPLFLKYPFLNEITLMVAVSFLFVFIKVSITRKRIVP